MEIESRFKYNPLVLIRKESWTFITSAGKFNVIKVSTWTHMENNMLLNFTVTKRWILFEIYLIAKL